MEGLLRLFCALRSRNSGGVVDRFLLQRQHLCRFGAKPLTMAFTLGSLLLASILFVNAIAVLNEQRFLSKST